MWGEHVHHGLWRTGFESAELAVRQLTALVAERGGVGAGSAVCDVGCGYGATARLLSSAYGARVTGITLSARQFEYAQARAPDGLEPTFLLGDWLDNAFASSSFDVVIAIESTEHMADKLRCFAEAHRVLRAGGRLVVAAWLCSGQARAWEAKWLLEPICREGRIPGMGSREEYIAWLARSGFELSGVEDLSLQVKRTWSLCIAAMLRGLASDGRYRRFLLDSAQRQRAFGLTLFRLWLAYETGAMRYAVFTAARR